jgi:hypothetical protein
MKQALKHLKNKRGVPYLYEVNATFFHFILVQTACLLWALLMRSSVIYDLARAFDAPHSFMQLLNFGNSVAGFIGYTLLSYSVLLVVASSVAVYRLGRIVDPDPS